MSKNILKLFCFLSGELRSNQNMNDKEKNLYPDPKKKQRTTKTLKHISDQKNLI